MRMSRIKKSCAPRYARWLQSTNNITQQFLAIGGRQDFVSLAGGLPASELYPIELMREAMDRALTRWGSHALEYGPVEGFPALRDAIARRMSRMTGRRFAVDNILITTGAMQGLDLMGKVLLDPGDLVVAQFPTYLGALDAWRARQPVYEKLTWDLDRPGFDEALRRAKFAYAVPNYSNPTGVLVPTPARQLLLEKVVEAGTLLVEDDPYLPLQLDGAPGPSILAIDSAMGEQAPYRGSVVYLGTLSKSVVPGLRVGWLVADPELVQTLAVAKQSSDISSSMLTHALALEFVDSTFEELHAPKVVAVYRERRNALLHAAEEYLSDWFEWDVPPGGMFVWMRARDGTDAPVINTNDLYAYAVDEKVAFVPSSVFDFEGRLTTAMRVNFSRSSPEVIAEGVRRLRRAVERYLTSNSRVPPSLSRASF
jgi:2-aminoadipate transaminase